MHDLPCAKKLKNYRRKSRIREESGKKAAERSSNPKRWVSQEVNLDLGRRGSAQSGNIRNEVVDCIRPRSNTG